MAHAVEDDPISNPTGQPRRKARRRLALPTTLALTMLVVTQVVLAVPPTGDFTISPTVAQIDQEVTFTAIDLADTDGGTPTDITWDFGDGTSGSGTSTSHSYSSAGEKTVTMTIADPEGLPAETTSVTKTLRVNAPPTAAISCSPTTLAANQATTCSAAGSTDSDGTVASYAWDGDGDGQFDAGRSDASEQFSFATPGARTITVRVTDSDGATDTAQQTVTVNNAAPTATFTFLPTNPEVGDTVSFDGTASSDPEGQALTYAWDLDNDGAFDDGSGDTASHVFSTGGNKTVRLRVTDPQNNSDTDIQSVPVANADPVASFGFQGANLVTPQVPDVGEIVTFTSTSTDPDGDNTIVDWDWDLDNDGQFDDGSGPSITHSFSSAGTKTVGLRVTDSSGAQNSTTAPVGINALPVARAGILNDQAEPGQRNDVPLVNQAFLLTAGEVPEFPPAPASPGSTDAEGPIEDEDFKWDLDNDGAFDDATGESIPFGPFSTAESRTVKLEVTDSDDAKATATLTFNVNSAPMPRFVVEPLTPIIDQTVTFTSTSFDAQDNSGQLTYNWDLDDDGNFGEAGEQGPTVQRSFPTANTSPGHRVRLRVTDSGGITRETPRMIMVQNTIPKGGFTWSPGSPLPGQAVTFTGTASSPTGKPLGAMQWDFDFDPSKDQFDVNATGSSVSHSFPSSGTKTVALRVTETGGGFAIVYDRITVNAAPRASFSASPRSAFVNDTITLSSTSSDPDGPLVRQEWDLDNDGRFDDANAAVVVTKFRKRGRYPIKLRVTDSKGATATASGEVTVRTRPLAVLSGVVIGIKGSLRGARTEIKRLLVRAPTGARISVRCRGKGCPKPTRKKAKGGKRLRFKSVERAFNPGTKLIVTVTKKGYIGKQTTFTIRRGLEPLRRDRCLTPGAKKAKRCPAP